MHNEPTLALGDPRLDRDHAELQRLAQRLAQTRNRQEVLAALDELALHCAAHFAAEDEDLRRMQGNDDAVCHIDEHAAVLGSLAEVNAWVIENDDVVGMANLVQSLCAELDRWLPEHVHYMDSAVAAYRSKNRFGGAPVAFAPRPPV
jgi:hemerythrin-like metal-binding protein